MLSDFIEYLGRSYGVMDLLDALGIAFEVA